MQEGQRFSIPHYAEHGRKHLIQNQPAKLQEPDRTWEREATPTSSSPSGTGACPPAPPPADRTSPRRHLQPGHRQASPGAALLPWINATYPRIPGICPQARHAATEVSKSIATSVQRRRRWADCTHMALVVVRLQPGERIWTAYLPPVASRSTRFCTDLNGSRRPPSRAVSGPSWPN